MPSIVPSTPEDYYIVVNSFGRLGTAFAETDIDRFIKAWINVAGSLLKGVRGMAA